MKRVPAQLYGYSTIDTVVSATDPAGNIGNVYTDPSGQNWIFVQTDTALVATNTPLYWKSKTAFTVTPTIGSSTTKEYAGVNVPASVPISNYFWMKMGTTDLGIVSGGTTLTPRTVIVNLAAADTAGGLLAWQNPELVPILVTRLILRVTTATTGASTADFGMTVTNATTSADNLIDGKDLNAATGSFDNTIDGGTNGRAAAVVPVGKWITGSKASGACAGLVGQAIITYIPFQT